MTERTNPPPGTPGTSVPPAAPGASQAPPAPLTTPSKVPSGVHAMRRGGARREVTERVTLKSEDGKEQEGWALNVSRGGLRAILEDKVILGQKFEITLGSDEPSSIGPAASFGFRKSPTARSSASSSPA